jgi:tetratricopeptide (TPR) repeat protein
MDPKKAYNIFITVVILFFVTGCIYIVYKKDGRTRYNLASMYDKRSGTDLNDFSLSFQTAYDSGNFLEANKVADGELSKKGGTVTTYLLKASTLAQQASIQFKEKELGDQALEFINKALELEPENIDALLLKGYVYEIQQNYSEAHKFYEQALSFDPKNADLLAQNAHAYELEGKFDKAKVLYTEAYKLDETNNAAKAGLAKILAKNKDYENAIQLMQDIANTSTNGREKAEAYNTISVLSIRAKRGNLNEIQKYNDLALKADPSFPLAYVQQGKILFARSIDQKDPEKRDALIKSSLDALGKAIQLNPNQAMAHFQLMNNMILLGRTTEAKAVQKHLPGIIRNDITLNKEQKEILLNIVNNIKIK